MRQRTIKKQYWINANEEKLLQEKSNKAGLSEAEFIRCLIRGTKLKERPNKDMSEFIKQITGMANNMNQIARAINRSGYIDKYDIEEMKKDLCNFYDKFEKEFYNDKQNTNKKTSTSTETNTNANNNTKKVDPRIARWQLSR